MVNFSLSKKHPGKAWGWVFNLEVLEWALPLVSSVVAFGIVVVGHWHTRELLNLDHLSMMFFFGIIGPILIWRLLVWIHGLMEAQEKANLEILNLNRDLEKKVMERTAALEQRNSELDQANANLLELDEMKSDFVALVSHELRAPLTALNGGLELALQSGEILPERSRAILEIMSDESRRLTAFIQSILDVSRLEAGSLAIRFGPVAVRPLLEQAAAIILSSSQRTVEWHMTDMPPIWGDESYLEQVIRNFISNADKYSPPEKPIELCAVMDDDQIRISVRDFGPGIPDEVGGRVFNRFSRFQSQDSAPSGWGLGLYLGRKLIEAQNGKIGFVSPIREDHGVSFGSEFFILMPIAQTPEDDLE